MSKGHPIEDNEMIMQPRGFAATGLFPSVKKEYEEQKQMNIVMNTVRSQYNYPPKGCDDALAIIESIKQQITSMNEIIASGVSNKSEANYKLRAYQEVLNEFQTYVNVSKCISNALLEENQQFNDNVLQALDKENTDSGIKSKNNNLLIFGTLGLLVIGSMILILRK